MIQMASALAIVTVFIGLWIPISTIYSRRRGGVIRETKIPLQELELKMEGGGLFARRGVIAGFYGNLAEVINLV
jgi:hypothetical protein